MSIRRNISQRTKIVGNEAVDNPDITIHRIGGDDLIVPITPRSIRRYVLMQEDFIRLEFSLVVPIHIAIGDYVQDDIFGRFVVTEEQMPKYNQQTGGYDYSVRLDADYMQWKNWLYCLVVGGKRMESRWDLTDRLSTHVQQIADNVNILINAESTPHYNTETGTTTYTNTGYGIDITASNANEIKHLPYEGVGIIEAMNKIAEAWECEWWVTNDSVTIGNTTYDKTIHFGKCENAIGISHESIEDGAYVMELGNNVESMDIARDQQTYCNRLYAYGGTQNIPEDYDRKLEFTASVESNEFWDALRELSLDKILGESTIIPTIFSAGAWNSPTGATRTYKQTWSAMLYGQQTIDLAMISSVEIESEDWAGTLMPTVGLNVVLKIGSETATLINKPNVLPGGAEGISPSGGGTKAWVERIDYIHEHNIGGSASVPISVKVEISWSVTLSQEHINDIITPATEGTATATKDASSGTKQVEVEFNGNVYTCTFSGETKRISPRPRGLNANAIYKINNLDLLKVPESWYSVDYDAGTIATMGEKRLHMPLATYPNRYMETETFTNNTRVVEQAVIFDKVFPKLRLRISELSEYPMKQKVEHSDGSVSWEDWTQYKFKAEYDNNGTWTEFNFRTSYMLDGAKLQIVFSTPSDINATGNLLAGMTFDVGFDEREYTIIRNEDYGVLLPDKRLKPTLHDEFVLVGWNPRAMNELGMVAAAEAELATKASEYLNAISEGQFTINVRMMSERLQFYPFCTGNDDNGRRMFGLLDAGTKVKVNHAALPNGYKVSRVLGYEYKLDIPYDTPTYIIGETEAFSRLKKIEKEITKL